VKQLGSGSVSQYDVRHALDETSIGSGRDSVKTPRASGRCLCGAVTYQVSGPLRDVLICHCEECRRWGGYVGAFTAVRREDLAIENESALRWIASPHSDRHARRGFCGECGSSLFWEPAGGERLSIAAGTLDRPTGLRIAAHWYTHQAGDYDEVPTDGLPRDSELAGFEIPWR
jgi:hypothetical protein